MIQSSQLRLPLKVYSEIVVRSASGESLLNSVTPITSENIDKFYARGDRLQLTAQNLRRAGFEVLDIGTMSITIAATPEVYERSFQTTLESVERPVIKEFGLIATGTFINAVDSKPFGEIDVSHTPWHEFLDGVAINEPIYYFQSGLPSPLPPITSQEYLSVPEGVAQGLNATVAHQQGITGKGIHVVMVDTGWYPHPFFRQQNYNVKVYLAPGSQDPLIDESGHGTGESANLLAIAPGINLTIVKADIAFEGKFRNINSISALRSAIALKPHIISCSWGSDERGSNLSPYNRLLAATVAKATSEGIIMVFAAGNGHYGFPAQHPEAIAAGGVYLNLNGSLRGKLEASNYASSFISPIYQNRQVPDVCGLVGQLPYGSYIMLPIPPGSWADQRLASVQDGTEATDGWAAFSGTSAAAPQLAGICALMKQANPNLSPAEAKKILEQTARDVSDGFSNPSSSGAAARAGPDLATGYGLADAYAAVQAVGVGNNTSCCDNCASSNASSTASSNQNLSNNYLTKTVEKTMASEFPKLEKRLDELLWKFEKELKLAVEEYGLENVELRLSAANFISRSPITKIAYSLRKTLEEGLGISFDKNTGEIIINKSQITEEHISSAQGLLKIGRYQEIAISVLTEALSITKDDFKGNKDITNAQEKAKEIKKLASEALSQSSSEIAMFDTNGNSKNYLSGTTFFDTMWITIKATGEKKFCEVNSNNGTAVCTGGETYSADEFLS